MKYFILFILLGVTLAGNAQICLGNFTYDTAVSFDPNWVYGCATGSSCSGGTQFVNLATCEPTTAMDACAPAPSACGTATNGSDLWYKFYAHSTTVTISVIQNTSFVTAIQAFSQGTDCATLTQIGCIVAGGPSSGVQLVLPGMTLGEQYYYRVFGSANNASHRTGNFCFCGSTGMSDTPLPVSLSFHVNTSESAAWLDWTATDATSIAHFEVERSADATTFAKIGQVEANPSGTTATYQFLDSELPNGTSYYRLKAVDTDGLVEYSNVVELVAENTLTFEIAGNPCKNLLHVQSQTAFQGQIVNMHGSNLLVQDLQAGQNEVDIQDLGSGIYFLRNATNGAVRKFIVMK